MEAKFGLSLLFIILGTLAVHGARQENKQESPFLAGAKRAARQHNQNKRVDPGTVIAVASLSKDLLETLLDQLGSIERKIAFGIANETPYEWMALNTYFRSGTSDDVLPRLVQRNKAALYTARKTKGPVATGCVGVIAYYMPALQKTVAILFSVPFDYNLYSNWWDVRIYDGEVRAHQKMYEDMYYGNPYRGDNGWHKKSLGHGFVVDGSMTSAGKSLMELHIIKN